MAWLALLAAAAGCQKNVSTPPGTEIVRWEAAAAPALGPRVEKDVRIHARPERKGQAVFAVHVETGPVEADEGGAKVRRAAPLAVRVSVERNGDWTFDGRCEDAKGPAAAGPSVVCTVRMRYEDSFNEVSSRLELQVGGDGSVHATVPGGSATFE